MNKQIVTLVLMLLYSAPALPAECVVLLHGLARTSNSMNELEQKLTNKGYYVANVDYLSREKKIIGLSEIAINEGLSRYHEYTSSLVNFVTHSLAGINVLPFLMHPLCFQDTDKYE